MIANYIMTIISIIGIFFSSLFSTQNNLVKTNCEGNFSATVKRIVDGDTLEVRECSRHIRLALANTPEINEDGWSEATNFTKNLCTVGTSVMFEQDAGQPYDVYGRIVAEVFCQNKNLNAELIVNNLAVIETQYCRRSEFATEGWAWDNGCKNTLK